MPLGLLTVVGFLGAAGALVGGVLLMHVIAALINSTDRRVADSLEKVGTLEFKKSVVNNVTRKAPPKAAHKPAAPKAAAAGEAAPAGDAHAAAAAPAATGSNDTSLSKIAKVWIEPGCIVCDACVNTCPEVFKIEGETCIVLPNADLQKLQEIKDAAAGCPVDVIRYS